MKDELQAKYEQDGYCVVRGLISHEAIDRLLEIYRASVLRSSFTVW